MDKAELIMEKIAAGGHFRAAGSSIYKGVRSAAGTARGQVSKGWAGIKGGATVGKAKAMEYAGSAKAKAGKAYSKGKDKATAAYEKAKTKVKGTKAAKDIGVMKAHNKTSKSYKGARKRTAIRAGVVGAGAIASGGAAYALSKKAELALEKLAEAYLS